MFRAVHNLDWPENKPFFKYCRKEHMEAFFRDGTLRIGTLFDYRRAIAHGELIGDQSEGVLLLNGTITNKLIQKNPNILPGFSFAGSRVEVKVEDCKIESPDVYIFSCSKTYSDEALKQWARDPQARYDACYAITRPFEFCEAISRVIAEKARFLGLAPVFYYEGETELWEKELVAVNVAQLKGGKRYSGQVEVRGLWEPIGEASPFLIQVPEARTYCARYKSLQRKNRRRPV